MIDFMVKWAEDLGHDLTCDFTQDSQLPECYPSLRVINQGRRGLWLSDGEELAPR